MKRKLFGIGIIILILMACPSPIETNFTVTFMNSDGVSVLHSETITGPVAHLTTFPPSPEKTGNNFKGWTTKQGTSELFSLSDSIIEDITLFPVWSSYNYTVTFDSQSAETTASPSSISVESPNISTGSLPSAPIKDGFSFGGWYTLPKGKGTVFSEVTTVSKDETVYAYWTDYAYTLSFNYQGGIGPANSDIIVASPAVSAGSFPEPPTKTGFIFGGWFTGVNGTGNSVTESTTITKNTVLYANWDEYSYTITFDSGSTDSAADPGTKTVNSPETTISSLPTPPTKTTQVFGGWYTEPDGAGTLFNAATTVTGNDTVFAYWADYAYTLSFNYQGGIGPANSDIIIASPSISAGSFPEPPTKTGYIFGGWFSGVNGTGNSVTESTTITKNTVLYANWDEYSYTITFDSGSANSAADPGTKTVNSPDTTISNLPTPPTKTTQVFGGWYTEPDGAGTVFNAATTVSGNDTVFAYWADYAYTLSFNYQGGIGSADSDIIIASPAVSAGSFPEPPTKTGYIFGGWFTGVNGTGNSVTESTTITKNTILYANWDEYSYTITFNSGSADSAADPGTKTVNSPDTTISSLPTSPTKTTQVFGGWYTEPDGAGTLFNAATTVTGNDTVFAYWADYAYTISFNYQEGIGPTDSEIIVASPSVSAGSFPEPPTKTGYIFGGWFTGVNGTGNSVTESTTITKNTILYANWDEYSYTITFDSGSADSAADPGTRTVTSPQTTISSLPTPPSKTTQVFGGWYTEPDGAGTAFNAATTVKADDTLYAYWTDYAYTISFDYQGGSGPLNTEKIITSPSVSLETFPEPPTKTGYIFMGWFTEPEGAGSEISTATVITADDTIYAKWQEYGYQIDFDSQSATIPTDTETRIISSPKISLETLPSPPEKTGYIFGGWFTGKNGSGNEIISTTTITANQTLYAYWISYDYQVTFNSEGAQSGGSPSIIQVASPQTTIGSLPSEPLKTGYIFGGWYSETEGAGTEITASTAISSDTTVYAKWNTYSYTVTFLPGGADSPSEPVEIQVESPSTTLGSLPPEPVYSGYTFSGWFTEAEGQGERFYGTTLVTGETTLYAYWRNNFVIQAVIDIPSTDAVEIINNNSTIQKGESISFRVQQSNLIRYQWFLNSIEQGSTTNQIVIDTTDISAGVYTIMLKVTFRDGTCGSAFCRFNVIN